jgi:hypothetical protein
LAVVWISCIVARVEDLELARAAFFDSGFS